MKIFCCLLFLLAFPIFTVPSIANGGTPKEYGAKKIKQSADRAKLTTGNNATTPRIPSNKSANSPENQIHNLDLPETTTISPVEKALASAHNSEIVRLSREGRNLESLVLFQQLDPSLQQIATKLVAAKCAWALGLVDLARDIWNELERLEQLTDQERTQLFLSHSIMEFQEREYSRATELAKLALNQATAISTSANDLSELKAQAWLVLGDASARTGRLAECRDYYSKAIELGSRNTANEARYNLGRLLFELGDRVKSKEIIQNISLDYHNAAEAIELLEDLEMADRDYIAAEKWSSEGLRNFQPYFQEDVRRYKRITILASLRKFEELEKELTQLKENYSDENTYYILGRALAVKESLLAYLDPTSDPQTRKEELIPALTSALIIANSPEKVAPQTPVLTKTEVSATDKRKRARIKNKGKNG